MSVEELKRRYPEFDAVPDGDVQYWLDDAALDCTDPRGVVMLAGHRLAEGGKGGAIGQGISSFKSGTFSATVSDAQAGRTGLDATKYGREYQAFVRARFGGPVMAWTEFTDAC